MASSANQYSKALASWIRKNPREVQWEIRDVPLVSFIEKVREGSALEVRTSLQRPSFFWILRAAKALLEDDPSGWSYLATFGEHWRAIIALPLMGERRDDNCHRTLNDLFIRYQASRPLIIWTMLGRKDLARWVCSWLEEDIEESETGLRPLEVMICALVRVWHGEDAAAFAEREDFAVYASIFAHWHDESALAVALREACDYHLSEIKGRGIFHGAFGAVPDSYWPMELLAIWRVRKELGLEMPQFSHRLVDNHPLYKLPPSDTRPVRDELLEALYEHHVPNSFLDEVVGSASLKPKMPRAPGWRKKAAGTT